MSRTVRRKSYVPIWVTREIIWNYGCAGYRQLEGDERKAKLRWWHEDKNSWLRISPNKSFRVIHESTQRMIAKGELSRSKRLIDYEVMINDRSPYDYWD